jgi:isoquinoline 1-oxidoreductase alpha subunit
MYYTRLVRAKVDKKRGYAVVEFQLNGQAVTAASEEDTPLLWVIRDELKLKGTKFGCGIAMCGACTVHIDGVATRSCITKVADVAGKSVTTIEGLDSDEGKALQEAWVEKQVPQCGYCQSGQIMQAASFLAVNPKPSDQQITQAMNGNLCRCMAYTRIHKAIKSAAGEEA